MAAGKRRQVSSPEKQRIVDLHQEGKSICIRPNYIVDVVFSADAHLIKVSCYPYNVSKERRRKRLSFSIECQNVEKFQSWQAAFQHVQSELQDSG